MANRSQNIKGRVLRNLRNYNLTTSVVLDEEIYDELTIAQDRIISDIFPDKIISITFIENEDTYPLTTDIEEPIERQNIASVKIIKSPTNSNNDYDNLGFFKPYFEVLSNTDFVNIVNSTNNLTGTPRIATIIENKLKVYPIPDLEASGETIDLYCYLSSSQGIINNDNNPELPEMFDKALELFATAQFLIGNDRIQWLNEFNFEVRRLRPIINRKHYNLYREPLTGW